MYAIIKQGGKQYKVSKDDELIVDRIVGNPGDKFDITDVVMVRDDHVLVENLDKVKITASIVEHLKGNKVIVFKYKPKKNYRRKFGHRSYLTKIKIEDIKIPKVKAGKKEKATKESVEAAEETKAAQTADTA
ncbi:MAG: 50S ribosomal protein L21 [Actinomycetota bacterium]